VAVEIRAFSRRAASGAVFGAATGLIVETAGLGSVVSYTGSSAHLVLWIALAGAAVAMTPAWRFALAIPSLFAAFWLLVVFTPFLAWLVPLTERVDPDDTADVVFVFSSGVQENGEPDSGYMARLFHGIELIARGRAPALAISESTPGTMAESLARRWLDELHLKAELLDLGPVGNTHDEATLLAARARERGWTRVLGVTSPTHEMRACATLEHEGLVAIASPAMETRYDIPKLQSADARVLAAGAVLHELVGEWMYRRRGWIR
jgi:uncharacterized SAM-binding protein YcdF (DUF218 family)